MRVVIDATAVHPTSGGAGTYLRSLIAALPEVGVEPIVLARSNDTTDWTGAAAVHRVAPKSRPARLVWEQVGLPKFLLQMRSDSGAKEPLVLHSPHYTMPRRVAPHVRRVVTIHDLTFFSRPQDHERSKRWLFRSSVRTAAKHADVVVCVSNSTAAALRDLGPVRAVVVVAPHGVDIDRYRTIAELSETERENEQLLLRAAQVDHPFVVHLGTIEPRKRVPELIEAVERLGRPELMLVLAGQVWPAYADRFPAAQSFERRLGFVSDETAAALLRHAAVVAYPSAEEGFGLPVLEALASGAMVVTTANSAMSEVAGSFARLINESGGVVAGLSDALRDSLELEATAAADGEEAHNNLRMQRHSHAKLYSWKNTAELHKHAYETASSSSV